MGSADVGSWLFLAALIVAPPLFLSAVLRKLRRSRLWALLWFAFLAAFHLWFVWSYDR